jgi:hypothetical protein
MQMKLLGIISVDFDVTGQLLIIYSAFIRYLRKKWEYNEASALAISKLQETL